MKSNRRVLFSRTASALWLVVCASTFAVTSACGANTAETRQGTETGNPPVIARDRVEVIADGEGVRVVGRSGAVPGGTEVRVRNTDNGAQATDQADENGAFEVFLEGSVDDDYEVGIDGGKSIEISGADATDDSTTNTDDATDDSSTDDSTDDSTTNTDDEPSTPDDEGPAPDDTVLPDDDTTDDGSIVERCDEDGKRLDAQLDALLGAASCTTDTDCVAAGTPWGRPCPGNPCRTWITSVDQLEQAQSDIDALRDQCDPECEPYLVSADCVEPPVATCFEGQCVDAAKVEFSCESKSEEHDAKQAMIAAAVDTSCSDDTQCTRIRFDNDCSQDFCAYDYPIAVDALSDTRAKLQELDELQCAPLVAAQCSFQFPECAQRNPWIPTCEQGSCVELYQCEKADEWLTDKSRAIANAVEHTCSADADCSVLSLHMACRDVCANVAVSNAERTGIETRLDDFERWACSEFEAAGCENPGAACPPVQFLAHCVDGVCEMQ